MKVKTTVLPANSVLKKDENTFNYCDSYQANFTDKDQNSSITQIGKAFFTNEPKWVRVLFAFRNKVVKLIGLKTPGNVSDRQKLLDEFNCEPGEQLGLFKVFSKTTNEVVFGEDDKHLNFRVSLFVEEQSPNSAQRTLTISTSVIFHNWLGRLYFLPVKPFHKILVPAMLKGILKQLESK